MKSIFLSSIFLITLSLSAQKKVFDVFLFGNKIGQTIVEKIIMDSVTVQYKLSSKSDVHIFFTHKTSEMNFDVVYKNGKLFSSYVKNVKDGVTEVVTVMWQGTKYVIKKGEEMIQQAQPIDISAVFLYFNEPLNRTKIFSERLGEFCNFAKTSEGEYQCKLASGVNNIYRYKNGNLVELEMSKGASVYMRPTP